MIFLNLRLMNREYDILEAADTDIIRLDLL